MKTIEQFINLLQIPEDEALGALISTFSPTQPGAQRQNWSRLTTFGNKAPSTSEIWNIFQKGDFKCSKCASHRRITIDHVNGDATNHSPDNLVLLCFDCNREKSRKGTKDKHHGLRIYKAVIDLEKKLNRFPTNSEIIKQANVTQIGGAFYLVKFLKCKLGYI